MINQYYNKDEDTREGGNILERFLYAHKEINEDKFIFPITGLLIDPDDMIKIGVVSFVNKEYLYRDILNKELVEYLDIMGIYMSTPTFAIVDFSDFGDVENICADGKNSLALQILKSTIGAIYISINDIKDTPDKERRIVISDLGAHEVDEGLNTYLIWINGEYYVQPNNVKEHLVAKAIDFNLENITGFTDILEKPFIKRTEYENKVSKALEILYSTFHEPYTRERILKLSIILNFIFRDNGNKKLEITHIGGKLKTIFNTIQKKYILENIPRYICDGKATKDIGKIVVHIYKKIRNEVMHGRVDLNTEYAVCNTEDYICLKIISIETLKFMVSNPKAKKCKDTEQFNSWIDSERHTGNN